MTSDDPPRISDDDLPGRVPVRPQGVDVGVDTAPRPRPHRRPQLGAQATAPEQAGLRREVEVVHWLWITLWRHIIHRDVHTRCGQIMTSNTANGFVHSPLWMDVETEAVVAEKTMRACDLHVDARSAVHRASPRGGDRPTGQPQAHAGCELGGCRLSTVSTAPTTMTRPSMREIRPEYTAPTDPERRGLRKAPSWDGRDGGTDLRDVGPVVHNRLHGLVSEAPMSIVAK